MATHGRFLSGPQKREIYFLNYTNKIKLTVYVNFHYIFFYLYFLLLNFDGTQKTHCILDVTFQKYLFVTPVIMHLYIILE